MKDLKMFQIEAIDEMFCIIATDSQHAKEILFKEEDSIQPDEIIDTNELSEEEMKERTILANEDMELPEMNLFDYFRKYKGEGGPGELVCSTLYVD